MNFQKIFRQQMKLKKTWKKNKVINVIRGCDAVIKVRRWRAPCPEFESRWSLANFQAIVKWLNKPTC